MNHKGVGSRGAQGAGQPLFLLSLYRNVIFSIQIYPDDHYNTPRSDISTGSSEQFPTPLKIQLSVKVIQDLALWIIRYTLPVAITANVQYLSPVTIDTNVDIFHLTITINDL